MRNIFIDSANLPAHYCMHPARAEQSIRGPDGRLYQLLGIREKDYSIAHRIWVGVQAFVKTIFSFGLGLLFDQVREEWTVSFTGKRYFKVYAPTENHSTERTSQLSSQILTHSSTDEQRAAQTGETTQEGQLNEASRTLYEKINNELIRLNAKDYSPEVWFSFYAFISTIAKDAEEKFSLSSDQLQNLNIFEGKVLSKEDLKKFTLYFGSCSPREQGWVQVFANNQASFCMHTLMQREDRQELVQEIKNELARQHQTFESPRNLITPSTCFWLNLKDLASFSEKSEFIRLYQNA
ncbi:hypothetical protein [Candidatus Protochlamydia phocaeensis]|uniref:hypothetical protein n=1 Tax=Candidatus Protochlamydia phocaeensis TaxID=1414722 RepID=UPI0008384385|nr:hypothetical protein [Candidatus Protochlamydia phocaeensis]